MVTSLGVSEGSLWRKIKSLIKCQFLVDKGNYYQLISYDCLWSHLGFNLSYPKLYKGKGTIERLQRKGSFKIHKINVSHLQQLFYFICYEDIKLNLQRQGYSILKHLRTSLSQKSIHLSTAMQKYILSKVSLKDFKSFEVLNRLILSLEKNTANWIKTSFADVTLSCQGISDLLGYTTPTSGWEIQQELKKLGLLKIKTRKCVVTKDRLEAKTLKREFEDDSHYVYVSGCLLYFNSNLLTPIL